MEKVSFVIPCYRSENTLEKVVEEIKTTMKQLHQYTYEVILVEDASPDDTWQTIERIVQKEENVTGISFAKNFGQHSALMAGFHYVQGDIVVCLDDDGQTPAGEVGKFLEKIAQGDDVVYASYEDKKHGGVRNLGSMINSKMTEWLLEKPRELYVSSYFAARRFVIDEVMKYENSYPYVLGLILRSTKRIGNVPVNHRERFKGQSGYSMKKLLSLWINGFTAFSVKPLRVVTFAGVIVAFSGVLYAIWTIIKKVVFAMAPVGWSSIMAVLLILGGMILFVLGMIGEYIGRIYISINNAPQYVVREEKRSKKQIKNEEK